MAVHTQSKILEMDMQFFLACTYCGNQGPVNKIHWGLKPRQQKVTNHRRSLKEEAVLSLWKQPFPVPHAEFNSKCDAA